MTRIRGLWWTGARVLPAVCIIALAVAGCGVSSATVSGGSTQTPHATATAHSTPTSGHTMPTPTWQPDGGPPHALAWYQVDSANVPQIWASLNGAVPRQITHVAPDHAECADQVAWSPPVFSPDLTHIVASLGSEQCGDGPLRGNISTITVATGAVTMVRAASTDTTINLLDHDAGWINNSTIWFLNYGGFYTYALGAPSPTHVAPLNQPLDGVVRGSTLFWANSFGSTPSGPFTAHLQRYDLSTHSALPGSIAMGTINGCQCSGGAIGPPGWDVSPDGSHIVYQSVTPASGANPGIASARFYYANADGSGASQIASYVATNGLAGMQFSPNGQLVAIAGAVPSPDVISASVTSPGNQGDPNLRFYHPDAYGIPVWKWDSSTFWAAGPTSDQTSTDLYAFTLSGSSSALAQPGAFNPWYTIGS
jgi:hypothetical protein